MAIAEVHSVTTGHAYAGIFPPEAPKPTLDELARLWHERVDASCSGTSTRAAVLVADSDYVTRSPGPQDLPIVGVAAAELLDESPLDGRADVVLLRSLYVVPGQWDRGLGRALHDAIVIRARTWNASAVDVPVLEGNERGRAWYLRHGYAPTGVRLPAFGDLDLWDEGLRLTAPFA